MTSGSPTTENRQNQGQKQGKQEENKEELWLIRFFRWLNEDENGAIVAIFVISILLPILGVVGIGLYAGWGHQFGVGILTAASATAVGLLFGLLFGVPRFVSSGQLRLTAKQTSQQGASPATSSESTPTGATVAPSSNLAEISDWLTKLLLGAGLVSLTRLGTPLAHLVDSVGAGLSPNGVATGSSKVVGAAIMFGFTALGFLYGYMLTTTWYRVELGKLYGSGKKDGSSPASGSSTPGTHITAKQTDTHEVDIHRGA